MLEVIPRAESGLPVPTAAALDGKAHSLVLHHWGSFKPTNNARVRELRALHLQRISSVGEAYNWLVGHDAPGKAWELRGRGRRPGGQRNVGGFDNNAGTRSIVVNGDYRTPGNPSSPIGGDLIETIAQLVVREHLAGDMPSQITHGHTNYVRPDGNGCCQATSCPGDRLLEAIPTINKRIRNLLEDDMPLSDSDLKKVELAVWRRRMRDDVTGSELFAETMLRKTREDAAASRAQTTMDKLKAAAKVAGAGAAGGGAVAVVDEIARRLAG